MRPWLGSGLPLQCLSFPFDSRSSSQSATSNSDQEVGMSLFRLDASIRLEGSHSRDIANIVEQEWRTAHPHSPVVTRHIGVDPIPATAWSTAVNATYVLAGRRSPEQRAAVDMAA